MKLISFLIIVFTITSCVYDKQDVSPDLVSRSGYPHDVGEILVKRCATAGCHNSESRQTSSGLDFSSWDKVFEGGRNGSSVVPFSSPFSYLMYTINTDTLRTNADGTRVPVLFPTMPYLQSHLSESEYQTIKNWIDNGAPDKNGFVKFSDNQNRKKIYICIQGLDKVVVMDALTKVIMRVVDVGNTSNRIEGPHQIKISPDGQYWYVVFFSGDVVQRYRTSDDLFAGEVSVGTGDWNTIIFSPDGTRGFVNATLLGKTAIVDLADFNTSNIRFITPETPHGGFITPDGHWLYLTAQQGNFINKVDLTSAPFYDFDAIVLQPGQPKTTTSSLDPHEIILSPDGSKYFVACQTSNEIRVFNTSDDSFITTIPVGTKPQELAVSATHPYLVVSCTEEVLTTSEKGKVYFIDYNTLSITGSVYAGYQPHGIAVNDEEDLVYVANLNADTNGPAPHHPLPGSALRNGYLTMIDMNTLSLYNHTLSDGENFEYRCELMPFPYYISYLP